MTEYVCELPVEGMASFVSGSTTRRPARGLPSHGEPIAKGIEGLGERLHVLKGIQVLLREGGGRMSEYVVYRTLGNGRCLVLDGTRIAGGKPDYRGNNYITSWVTNETYGPVDELKSENAKLRELVCGLIYATHLADRARLIADAAEFGIEVGE